MQSPKVRYERARLYEEVWGESVTHVAAKYGLSDVALRKICERLAVPTPPVGYWQKVQAGRAPRKAQLPPYSGPEFLERWRRVGELKAEASMPEPKAVLDQIAFEAKPENRIRVGDDLHACHPLVSNTTKALKKPQVDKRGVTYPGGPGALNISVTEPYQRRALLLMDALLKAAEERGWRVHVVNEYPRRTLVEVNNESISVRVTERTKRSNRPLTLEEQRKLKYEDGWKPWNPWRFASTGEFTLHLLREDSRFSAATFSDNRKHALEMQLNDVLVGIIAESIRRKDVREVARLRQIERQMAEQARREDERKEMEEQAKLEALEQEVSQWHRAQRIRRYVSAVEAWAVQKAGEPSAELITWIAWARNRAESLDPLCSTAESQYAEWV